MELKSRKYLFFLIILFLSANSCDKVQNSQVPNVPVNFTVNITNTIDLNATGNAVYFPNVGFGGIIIYCALPGEEYYAFDATCTNELSSQCQVLKDQNLKNPPCLLTSPLVTCSCCESQFLTMTYSADPVSGPAPAPLKSYNTSMVNSFTLRVYN